MEEYDERLNVDSEEFWEDVYRNLFEHIINTSAIEVRKMICKNGVGTKARKRCENAMNYFAQREELCKAYLMQCIAREIKNFEHIKF